MAPRSEVDSIYDEFKGRWSSLAVGITSGIAGMTRASEEASLADEVRGAVCPVFNATSRHQIETMALPS